MSASGRWLVSKRFDVLIFGGSAALAMSLLVAGRALGVLEGPMPAWAWIATVVGVDVAHVWATAYRVYLDPEERKRRPGLYTAIPLTAYVTGVLLYSLSAGLFWRALAYVAVFHFVRQQYGWMALYRSRLGASTRLDRWLDAAAIYTATLWPLLWWHAHLPRAFDWFVAGDFLPGVPRAAALVLLPAHIAITTVYAARQLFLWRAGRAVSPGKNLVLATTWITWHTGIVFLDSDYAFTVMNVLVHGIPYMAFVWVYGRARFRDAAGAVAAVFRRGLIPVFMGSLVVAAWSEEWLWDRLVWHEHAGLFPGPAVSLGTEALALLVPLLALPQATHYVLDAWIWRVRPGGDVGLRRHLGF